MLYPRNKGYTVRTMAATLRKLKRRRRVPIKVRGAYPARWRCWREEFSESVWIARMMNRRKIDD